jgi:hypothetical protein
VVTDFGADQPFAQAMDKIVEHYGVVLGESTIARITQGHAKRIFETAPPAQNWPTQAGTSTAIIVQTDGGMVPIVKIDTTQADKRKGKTLHWEEAKICLAHPQGARHWPLLARSKAALRRPGSASLTARCKPDLALTPPFMVWAMVRNG